MLSSLPVRTIEIPTALAHNAYPLAKALWHVLKRLPHNLSEVQRGSLNLSGLPAFLSVTPAVMPTPEVPVVRRVRLRVKPDSTAGGAASSAFIFNPFEKKKKGSGLGAQSSSAAVPQQAVSWVSKSVCSVKLCLGNPVPIPVRMGLSLVVEVTRVKDEHRPRVLKSGRLPCDVIIAPENMIRVLHDVPNTNVSLISS